MWVWKGNPSTIHKMNVKEKRTRNIRSLSCVVNKNFLFNWKKIDEKEKNQQPTTKICTIVTIQYPNRKKNIISMQLKNERSCHTRTFYRRRHIVYLLAFIWSVNFTLIEDTYEPYWCSEQETTQSCSFSFWNCVFSIDFVYARTFSSSICYFIFHQIRNFHHVKLCLKKCLQRIYHLHTLANTKTYCPVRIAIKKLKDFF